MRNGSHAFRLALGAVVALAGTPVLAGSGNSIYVRQVSSGGTNGNTLYIDQSQAQDSQVGNIGALTLLTPESSLTNLPATPNIPAQQIGQNNFAHVALNGIGGLVALLQNNSGYGTLGNSATINVGGAGIGSVEQVNGDGNSAVLTVNGAGAGAIRQNGSDNNADLTVNTGSVGILAQNGNNNSQAVQVTAPAGATITYTVNGSGLKTLSPVSVLTNGAAVTISQSMP